MFEIAMFEWKKLLPGLTSWHGRKAADVPGQQTRRCPMLRPCPHFTEWVKVLVPHKPPACTAHCPS